MQRYHRCKDDAFCRKSALPWFLAGLNIYQLQGVRPVEPQIPLFPNDSPESIQPTISLGESHSFTAGDVSVVIKENPYTLVFNSPGGAITTSHPKSQYLVDVPHHLTTHSASASSCLATDISANPYRYPNPTTLRYMVQELNISPGEKFYGFGEQFGAFVKNGTF